MIYLGSDHGGFELKKEIAILLADQEIEDLGTHTEESCDYPDIAKELALKVVQEQAKGILICRSGIGMSMAANRIRGARAALCLTEKMAEMSRRHNNANILVLGADHTDPDVIPKIIKKFFSTDFDGLQDDGERHKRRVAKLDVD